MTKILVLTKDKKDEKLIKKCCDGEWRQEKEETEELRKLIDFIDSWRPISLVITFDDKDSKRTRIIRELIANRYLTNEWEKDFKARYGSYTFKVLDLVNIFNPEQCILLSTTPTDGHALEQQLTDAWEKDLLRNEATTRILVLAGCHGGIQEREGKLDSIAVSVFADICIELTNTVSVIQYQTARSK